jgi:ABC-type long-subunit fatty acid transport system fused permease/ATPase subunit
MTLVESVMTLVVVAPVLGSSSTKVVTLPPPVPMRLVPLARE